MRLGLMQPYFFPYAGHFALIANTDTWVVFDTSQYTPQSWMNRNRVLHPAGGWMYLTVAVHRSPVGAAVREVTIVDPARSHHQVRARLTHYKRHAPFYGAVVDLVERAYSEMGGTSLVECNVAGLRCVCEYLGLPFEYRLCSELDVGSFGVDHPGGWAPAISAALGADAYLNPIGGRELFDPGEFARRGVRLEFLDMAPLVYETGPFAFEPSLSILDVLMWNPAEWVTAALGAATVVPAA